MSRARFTRADLESFRGAKVDDLIEPGVRLLFVGINPGLRTAAANAHFARPGNRFWPALQLAGITRDRMDMSGGMSAADRAELIAVGVGITNLVPSATARADELTTPQIRAAAAALTATVRRFEPRVVAVLGLTAYRQAFGRPKASPGRQPDDLAGAQLWVLPNPSGLNAHETAASLGVAYREPALAAGVPLVRCARRRPATPARPAPLAPGPLIKPAPSRALLDSARKDQRSPGRSSPRGG